MCFLYAIFVQFISKDSKGNKTVITVNIRVNYVDVHCLGHSQSRQTVGEQSSFYRGFVT